MAVVTPAIPRAKLHPLSHTQRCAVFGTFSFRYAPTADAPERIEINSAWLRANIVELELPHLAHLRGGKPLKTHVHRLAAPRWLALFDAWRDAGLSLKIVTFNGAFVSRYKRGKAGGALYDLSNHSWGTAIDLNAKWNGLGKAPMPVEKLGTVIPLVAIANELGFAWGGDFSNPDAMHFECVRITG